MPQEEQVVLVVQAAQAELQGQKEPEEPKAQA